MNHRRLMNRTNDFTKECDKHLLPEWAELHKEGYGETCLAFFLDEVKPNGRIALRYPGATRGHVVIDEHGCLKELVFYQETAWHAYKKTIHQLCEDCKGWPLFPDFFRRDVQ